MIIVVITVNVLQQKLQGLRGSMCSTMLLGFCGKGAEWHGDLVLRIRSFSNHPPFSQMLPLAPRLEENEVAIRMKLGFHLLALFSWASGSLFTQVIQMHAEVGSLSLYRNSESLQTPNPKRNSEPQILSLKTHTSLRPLQRDPALSLNPMFENPFF